MSDSESSQEIEVKVEQQHQAKVRELIHKGKQITPFYDEDTLYNIYKQAYYNDNVFINKLEIIVRTRRQQEEDNSSDWIYEKVHEKSANNKRSDREDEVNRERYNFLQDKKLIQRAVKYNPQDNHKGNDHLPRNKRQFRQKQEQNQGKSKNYNDKFDKSYPVVFKEKKLKFKEKQPEQISVTKSQIIEPKVSSTAVENSEKSQVKVPKYEQKKTNHSAYIKKKVKQAHEQLNKIQHNEAPEVKKEKKVQYKAKDEQNQQSKSQIKSNSTVQPLVKSSQNPIITQAVTNKTVENGTKSIEKKAETVQQKVSQVPTVQKTEARAQTQKRTVQRQSKLDPEVQKQFQNSLKQNPLILKIITPSQRLQKISYIKYPNGSYNEVKVRQMAQHH